MDRFIVQKNLMLALIIFYLKSNMDRFIVGNGFVAVLKSQI